MISKLATVIHIVISKSATVIHRVMSKLATVIHIVMSKLHGYLRSHRCRRAGSDKHVQGKGAGGGGGGRHKATRLGRCAFSI